MQWHAMIARSGPRTSYRTAPHAQPPWMTFIAPLLTKKVMQPGRSRVHSAGVFTSDFSVNEFLLVRKAGLRSAGDCCRGMQGEAGAAKAEGVVGVDIAAPRTANYATFGFNDAYHPRCRRARRSFDRNCFAGAEQSRESLGSNPPPRTEGRGCARLLPECR